MTEPLKENCEPLHQSHFTAPWNLPAIITHNCVFSYAVQLHTRVHVVRPHVCPWLLSAAVVRLCARWPVELRAGKKKINCCYYRHAPTLVHTTPTSLSLSHTNAHLLPSLEMFIWIFQRRWLARLSALMNYRDGESVSAWRTRFQVFEELTSVCLSSACSGSWCATRPGRCTSPSSPCWWDP